jgi:copper oxidase (laccase) domain-containing protein
MDVVDSGLCTYSNKRLYSYRKDGVTGRQASFIWIE